MLLVDPASTAGCQHDLVAGLFLTDEATVILSFAGTSGLEDLHTRLAGWRLESVSAARRWCTDTITEEEEWKEASLLPHHEKHNLFLQFELALQPRLHLWRTFTQPIMWNHLISQHQRSQNSSSWTMTLLFPCCSGEFAFHLFLHAWKTAARTFTGLNASC